MLLKLFNVELLFHGKGKKKGKCFFFKTNEKLPVFFFSSFLFISEKFTVVKQYKTLKNVALFFFVRQVSLFSNKCYSISFFLFKKTKNMQLSHFPNNIFFFLFYLIFVIFILTLRPSFFVRVLILIG